MVTGTTDVESLAVGRSAKVSFLAVGGQPEYGFKLSSCKVDFVSGERIIIADKLTTDPEVETIPIATDKACLIDYLKALQLEGLALRKQLTELITYGCVTIIRKGYLANVMNTTVLTINGRKIQVANVLLIANSAPLAMGQRIQPDSLVGFIPVAQLRTAPIYVLERVEH